MANKAIHKGRFSNTSRGYDNEAQDMSDFSSQEQNGSRYRAPSISSNISQKSLRSSIGTASTVPGEKIEVGLKKRVGLVSGTALIVGTMIGSGIFISPKGVLEGSGSVGLSLINWTLCGIISTFGALSYAELGTLISKSGAEYSYLFEAFGPCHKKLGSIPAFLFAWINMVLLKPASVAIIILTFATYTLEPFYDVCNGSQAAIKCLAALAILVLLVINCFSVKLATIVQNVFTALKMFALVIIIFGGFVKLGQVLITWVNCYSVRLAARVQVIFTAGKILALLIIIIGGIVRLGQGYTETLNSGFTGTQNNVGKIAIGLYNGMWAYDGWNNLNYVTEEIIEPYKNLPRSIMIGIPLVTVLYILVNISYFTVMSVPQLLDSPAVAVTWSEAVIGDINWIMPLFVALSTFGAANGTLFSGGRLTYVAAREGHMVEVLSMIHVKRYTPLPSLVFTCIIALIMIIPGDIASLIDFFSFAVWMFYGLTMAALIVLRFKMKDTPRPYKVPIVLPVIVLLVSLYLVVAPIIDNPQVEFLYAAMFILAGFIFYVPFVYFEKVLPGMEAFTTFMQLLMEVSSPTEETETET